MVQQSYDPVDGHPIFLASAAPDLGVDETLVGVYAADVGNRIIRANLAGLDAYPYKRKGLKGFALDTGYEYVHNGAAWVTAEAMVLLARQSVTGAGTMNFDNVFSSRFENYLVRVNIRTMSAGGVPSMQLRVNGNIAAGTDYRTVSRSNSSTAITGATTAEDRVPLTKGSVAALYAEVRIFDPAIASRTVFLANSHGVGSTTAAENGDITVQHNPSVAYDGFRMLTSGPLITGAVSVFGIG